MEFKKINRKVLLKYAFAAVFASTLLMQFNVILQRSSGEIKDFLRAKGDYAQLRNSYKTFAITTEAKKIIHPKSPVSISYSSSGIENVGARYNLYPLKLSKDWTYLIDLDHFVKDQRVFPKRKELSRRVFVYTHKGLPFLPEKKTAPGPSLSKKLLIFFSTVIFQILLGILILYLLNIPHKTTGYIWMATTGYLAGFCVFTALLWVLLILGFTLEISTLLILGTILLCLILVLILNNNSSPTEKLAVSREARGRLEKMLLVLTVLLASIITLWIISNPVKDWDTMANWMIKSKVIFQEKSLDLQYTHDNHNYYPILWPLHVAAQFTLQGGNYDEVALWSSALFFLILLFQLLKGFSLMGAKPIFTYVCLLAYIAYFISENPTISALPENAFLCFLTGLLVSICLWLKSPKDKHYLVLSIILAVGVNLIKMEGAVATMIIIFSMIAVKRKDIFTKTAKPFLLTLLLTTLLPVLWVYWIKSQGFSNGIVHLQSSLSMQKLIFLIRLNFQQFVKHGEFAVLFFGFAYFIFFSNPHKWNTSEKFLLSVSALLMIFKWLATLGWSEELILAPGIFNDTVWCLFLHTGPSLILLFCSRAFYQARAET